MGAVQGLWSGRCSVPGSREGRPRCRSLARRWHSSPVLPVPRCAGSLGEDGHLGRWAGVSLYPDCRRKDGVSKHANKTGPRTQLGSNSEVRSLFPKSLADTDFFCPVVLLSWHHADSFLALVLSRNSSVASVVFLVPK